MRKAIDYMILALKGVAMGAADVVPGVSGGTVAFISGIYGELVESIRGIDLQAVRLLFTGRFGQFWRKINGGFLVAVAAGIVLSVFSLARVMTWLLENAPIPTWAFFFGLIVASVVFVARDITRWNFPTVAALVLGSAAAFAITVLSPASTPETWWFIALSGAIAICAMILPGISGAFILLLLGKYRFFMEAIAEVRVGVIVLFLAGAVAGIISFSHLLSWLLRRHRNVTVAALTGFMVGSLNKVWPWKEVLETYTDGHGATHPLVERSVTPGRFAELGGDPALWQAVALCAAGFALIFVIEYAGKRIKKSEE